VRSKTRYASRATSQLQDLFDYIVQASGEERADAFVGALVDYCDRLPVSPYRGTKRDDIREGLRIVGFRRRVTIAFSVSDGATTVLGIFYGGQNVELALKEK
jgi:toxin ParE1/3/4